MLYIALLCFAAAAAQGNVTKAPQLSDLDQLSKKLLHILYQIQPERDKRHSPKPQPSAVPWILLPPNTTSSIIKKKSQPKYLLVKTRDLFDNSLYGLLPESGNLLGTTNSIVNQLINLAVQSAIPQKDKPFQSLLGASTPMTTLDLNRLLKVVGNDKLAMMVTTAPTPSPNEKKIKKTTGLPNNGTSKRAAEDFLAMCPGGSGGGGGGASEDLGGSAENNNVQSTMFIPTQDLNVETFEVSTRFVPMPDQFTREDLVASTTPMATAAPQIQPTPPPKGKTTEVIHKANASAGQSIANATSNSNFSQVLETIHTEMDKLKPAQQHQKKEGLPCPLIGSWISEKAGMVFKIIKEGADETPVDKERSNQPGFMTMEWDVSVLMPFNNIKLMTMTAIHEKSFTMATFTGECRICEGKEFVSGHWLVVKDETNCEDMNKGQDFYSDIWVRKLA